MLRRTQVAPAPAHKWAEDGKFDKATRKTIKEQFENPGTYSPDEEKSIKQGLNIVEKLGGDATKHPKVQLTKHKTNTPLLSAFICHDGTVHQTYGKVECTVPASILDNVAFLFDYEANLYKYDVNPNLLKYGVLERVNNHHSVFYYLTTPSPPFLSRDFVWSFIAKRINDNQIVCVLLPTLHDDAPIADTVVRAEFTRVYRLTSISPQITKLELFFHLDMKGTSVQRSNPTPPPLPQT